MGPDLGRCLRPNGAGCPCAGGVFALTGLAEPRIEPEIVFGLAKAPAAGMDEAALLDCIEWVAHGFEIVQSIFPGWKFSAADTVAAFGLHAALLIGPRHEIAPHVELWFATLASFEIDLCCDGAIVDRGHAANVLGGPLSALRYLVELLRAMRRSRRWPRAKSSRPERSRERFRSRLRRRGKPHCTALRLTR